MRSASGSASRYTYVLEKAPGDLPPEFRPALSPGEILMLGAFEGRYLNDSVGEFPAEWFVVARGLGRLNLTEKASDLSCNFFGVGSRQPLSAWKENGWAPSPQGRGVTDDHYRGLLTDPDRNPDERGWFQWYCRYWMGRRIPELDALQIRRWRAFNRHAGAIRANCKKGDLECRRRERQALLQWAYDPFI
jgi:hypothetical protein